MRIWMLMLPWLLIACAADTDKTTEQPNGRLIYEDHCTLCHGDAGDAQISGAKDLTTSILSAEKMKTRILNGRGVMKGYKDVLSAEEIDAVSAYVLALRTE